MSNKKKPWQPKGPAPNLTLQNANVIDVEAGKVIRNTSIYISDGLICDEAEFKCRHSPPKTTEIDLKSAYVCPGLIDLHVHLTAAPGQPSFSTLFSLDQTSSTLRAAYVAKRMLLRGFTTVRDPGGSNSSLRTAIAEHLIPGPRLFIAGKALSQTGGHADLRAAWQGDQYRCCDARTPGFGRVCDGVPACLEAARDELRQGADFLKVMCGGGVVSPADPLEMTQFTGEELRAISETAKAIGTYVTAHAYTDKAVRHAVENGCTGIEHGNFVSKETAEWLRGRGDVFVNPTLCTYEAMARPEYRQLFTEEAQKKNEQVLASGIESLTTFYEAGITMGFGTDLLAEMHELQNQEFEIRGRVLPAPEVLKHATVNAARILRMDGKLGTVVQQGAFADLLVLDKNPLDDIGVLADMGQHCKSILKDGRVVSSAIKGLEVDDIYHF